MCTENDMKVIPKNYSLDVCKVGQEKECCIYVMACADGVVCAKNTQLQAALKKRSQDGDMVAQGDNCRGL